MLIDLLRGVLGMSVLIVIAFLLSNDRKNIDWKLVVAGIAMQIVLALGILKVPFIYQMFDVIADKFTLLLSFTDEGAKFVFGDTWFNDVYVQTMQLNADGNLYYDTAKIGFHVCI
jgi:CNT family concentrative nucleoside transporter